MHPKPWTLGNYNGAWIIRDADGKTVMCNETYYPYILMAPEEWQMVVDAVNHYQHCRFDVPE